MLALIRRTSAAAASPLAFSRSRGPALSPMSLVVFLSLIPVCVQGPARALGAECRSSQCTIGILATALHASPSGADRHAMIDAWLPLGLAEVLVAAPPLQNVDLIEASDGSAGGVVGDFGPDGAVRAVTLDEQPADGEPVQENASSGLYWRWRAFMAAACDAARPARSSAALAQPHEVNMPEFSWTGRLKAFVREAQFRARLGAGDRDGTSGALARSDL